MKLTKKQLKKKNGMNKATKRAFKAGAKNPIYKNIAPDGMPEHFVKVSKGVPYVNADNFQ